MKVDRDGKGRWKKGQSGNPNGRSSEEMQARILAMRALAGVAPDAIERLKSLVQSGDEKVALGAVKVVLEHVIGKVDTKALSEEESPTVIVIDGYEVRPRVRPVNDEAERDAAV